MEWGWIIGAFVIFALFGMWKTSRRNNDPIYHHLLAKLFAAAEVTDDISDDCFEIRDFLKEVRKMQELDGGLKAGQKLAHLATMIPYYGNATPMMQSRARLIIDRIVRNGPINEYAEDNLISQIEQNPFLERAEQGEPHAQYMMGQLYTIGVPEYDRNAAVWYQKAAEQGHVEAQYQLDVMYRNGDVAEKSKKKPIMAIASILFIAFLALTWKNENFYLWIKALHIIAVISWMAGMLYLPRLFVYHASEAAGSPVSEKLKIMELKLLKVIINPAMMVTWGAGIWLMFSGLVDLAGWFWVKFALVFAMSGVHGWLSKYQMRFAADENQLSEKQWRLANEIPTVLMIGIVIVVIVRPF